MRSRKSRENLTTRSLKSMEISSMKVFSLKLLLMTRMELKIDSGLSSRVNSSNLQGVRMTGLASTCGKA